MKSILISAVTAVLMLFIQSTWLSHGLFLGVIPNLALSVLLFSSFVNKNGEGIIASFLAGIVADFLSAAPLGYFVFLFTGCAYLTTLVSYVTEKDFFVIPFLLGTGATILMGGLSKILVLIFSANIHSYQMFSAEFGIELIMNGFFTGLIFFILSFVQPFFEHSPRKALP